MHLERCQEQSQRTLDQFYEEFLRADHSPSRDGARAMLGVIGRLRALNDSRRVHGRTSHFTLCLLSADHLMAPSHVTIVINGGLGFRIDYLMPDHAAPWPGARVSAEAWTEDEAVRMILEAMELSGGWRL